MLHGVALKKTDCQQEAVRTAFADLEIVCFDEAVQIAVTQRTDRERINLGMLFKPLGFKPITFIN